MIHASQQQSLAAFWSKFEKATYVVTLTVRGRRKKPAATDTKYVRASSRDGAIRTARFHSSLPPRAEASCRFAHPVRDLCCEWRGEGEAPV